MVERNGRREGGPDGEAEGDRHVMARFGEGLKAIEAVAEDLS